MEDGACERTLAKEMADLIARGNSLVASVTGPGLYKNSNADVDYQAWYALARRVVAQVIPDRLEEFTRYYELPPGDTTVWAYDCTISELLLGQVPYPSEIGHANELGEKRLRRQVAIVASCGDVVQSKLADLRWSMAVGISEDELAEAQALLSEGRVRASGVLAGVVLERALRRLADRHGLEATAEKAAVVNDRLKSCHAYDEAMRARIQFLLAIRNKCSHPGEHEPTAEEVRDLLQGTPRILHLLA